MNFDIEKIISESRKKREVGKKMVEEGLANKPKTKFRLKSRKPQIFKFEGNYREAGKKGLDSGLRPPTGYESALITHKSYISNRSGIDKGRTYIYHVNFWLPVLGENSGMYSIYDPKALGRDIEFNQEELEEKLSGAEIYKGVRINRDEGVAFAPSETIRLGKETNWDKFAINGMNIAIFTPEGAENLAELGKNHFKHGYNWGLAKNDKIETRVSALDMYWDLSNSLNISSDIQDDNGHGRSFWVSTKEPVNK